MGGSFRVRLMLGGGAMEMLPKGWGVCRFAVRVDVEELAVYAIEKKCAAGAGYFADEEFVGVGGEGEGFVAGVEGAVSGGFDQVQGSELVGCFAAVFDGAGGWAELGVCDDGVEEVFVDAVDAAVGANVGGVGFCELQDPGYAGVGQAPTMSCRSTGSCRSPARDCGPSFR